MKSKLVGSSIYCNWIQIRIQIVLLGFGVLRLAQHKVREGAGAAYLEGALVAGKGLGRRSRSRRRQGRKISSKGGDQERVSLRENGSVVLLEKILV